MAGPSSLTLDYDAILTTTLFNLRKKVEDSISTTNALLFMLMKKKDGYESVSDLGDRISIPIMYGLSTADSYSGYDVLQTAPTDGLTTAFATWAQAAVPVSISGLEEKKNQGEARIIDLMTTKVKQAELGLQDFFGRGLLQGNGPNSATQITTPRTSPNNASVFVEPVFSLVRYDPTTSTVIQNINQSTNTWWRNKTFNSVSTTYAGFLKELRNLYNQCTKGPGGPPKFGILDQSVYELYEAALAASYRNPNFKEGNIPFDNLSFKQQVVTWDEFVPDVQGGSITQSTTSGTWGMLNLDFMGIKYHSDTNFVNTPFQRPVNQDAKVSQIMWMGQSYCSNRRKQGVMGGIDTTIVA